MRRPRSGVRYRQERWVTISPHRTDCNDPRCDCGEINVVVDRERVAQKSFQTGDLEYQLDHGRSE